LLQRRDLTNEPIDLLSRCVARAVSRNWQKRLNLGKQSPIGAHPGPSQHQADDRTQRHNDDEDCEPQLPASLPTQNSHPLARELFVERVELRHLTYGLIAARYRHFRQTFRATL